MLDVQAIEKDVIVASIVGPIIMQCKIGQPILGLRLERLTSQFISGFFAPFIDIIFRPFHGVDRRNLYG